MDRDQAGFFSENAAILLTSAAKRWPDSRADFAQAGTEIAAALYDRLPEEKNPPPPPCGNG